jgi:DNA-binding NtrC family response regulator
LIRARQRYEANIARAARAIGIPRPDLQAKMRALAVDIESTRVGDPEYAATE